MAIPKVFVSSTCFDLAEERSQLERFISNYGFQPVLSEYNDVFYNPDEHTHQACVNEVAHCDLFVLIISGRFGGMHKDGEGESITQAEFNAARQHNIPVFAFVKKDVLDAQFYFKENLRKEGEEFARKIRYPAIQKNADALNIFSFLDSVQRSATNNAIESYINFSEIETYLKKQWAGMFFLFLKNRKEVRESEKTSTLLTKMNATTEKLEKLVESLHDNDLGSEKTGQVVKLFEERKAVDSFYSFLFKVFDKVFDSFDFTVAFSPRVGCEYEKGVPVGFLNTNFDSWVDYINNVSGIHAEYDSLFDDGVEDLFVHLDDSNIGCVTVVVTDKEEGFLSDLFDKVKNADIEIVRSVLQDHFIPF